jgi:hypothetical protein
VANDFTCVAYWYQTKPTAHQTALPRGRANWPRAHPSRQPATTNVELNGTQLEETLREQWVKVTAHSASGGLRGWLQIEPGEGSVHIPIAVSADGDYSVQVRPFDAGFAGEVKMGVGGETMQVIQPVAGAPSRRPWVALGIAHAVNKEVVLEASGRSLGLQAVKLTRQP